MTPRNAERTVYINGEAATEISETLLREREQDKARLDEAYKKIDEGSQWWPEARYSIALKRRIRKAEKVGTRLVPAARMFDTIL